MILKTEQGQLTLPSDFSFEIEQNSAFFSDNGATSLAATIPATPGDQAKLGWPTRLGRSTRFVNAYPASIEHGAFHKKGTLMVTSATERSITCSMALEDSDLYARSKSIELKELFSDVTMTFADAAALYSYMYSVYTGQTICEFRLFPVAVDKNDDSYLMNNEPASSGNGVRQLVHDARIIEVDDQRISVPDGFGLSPFLRLGWFVAKMVELCGYTVEANCFSTDSRLSDLVLLNQCADACCGEVIHYADLVPNKTVGEIITWLNDKFNIQLSVNPSVGTAKIIQMEGILDGDSDMDISGKVLNGKTYAYSPTSRVILQSDTSLEGAAPIMSTPEQLLAKWGQCAELTESQFRDPANGLCMRKSTGEYYVVKEFMKVGLPTSYKVLERLGSNYFTYDRKNSEQSVEHNAIDIMVPMVWSNGCLCPYLGDRLYCRTTINNKEERQDQGIMICRYGGLASAGFYYYGTTQNTNDSGVTQSGKYILNAPGLYRQFWPQFNKLQRNNRVEISCKLDLTHKELLQYNLYSLKQLAGQHVIPSYLRYEVGRKIRCLEARFYLVKDYADEQTDQDTIIPPTLYKWEYNTGPFDEWYADMYMEYETMEGLHFEYRFADDDPFATQENPIYMPPPSALGQETMRVMRHMEWTAKDWMSGETIHWGDSYCPGWFYSVTL